MAAEASMDGQRALQVDRVALVQVAQRRATQRLRREPDREARVVQRRDRQADTVDGDAVAGAYAIRPYTRNHRAYHQIDTIPFLRRP